MNKKNYFLVFAVMLFINGCEKTVVNPVPDIYFSISLDIQSDPQFFFLRSQDNAMEISAQQIGVSTLGYNNSGLIVYNVGGGTFYAFDRTCPHEIPEIVKINLTDNNIASCPECKSQYVLPSEGIPAQGSASQYYLKKYKAEYNSASGMLYIFNN